MNLDFANLKKRFQSQSVLALTLESSQLAVSLVRRENGGARVVQSLTVPLGSEDVFKNPETVGSELAAALATAGIRERHCAVCVPPGWALMASTDLPEVSPGDLRGFFELRAERELPVSISDVSLGHCAYFLPDGKQRATLAAVPIKRMEALDKMLATAGCTAVSISLALDKCLSDSRAMLHFLANGNHTDAIITAGGGVVALRSLAGPSISGETEFDAGAFCREIRITLGRLPEVVRQQVRHARFSGPATSVQNLRIQIGYQLERMGIESDGAEGGETELAGAAVGAAENYLRDQPVAFEFFVPKTHRWQEILQKLDNKRYRLIIAAVIGLIVLPLLAFFVNSRIENSLENKWGAMQNNVTELDGLQQKIRRFRPWFEPAPQGLQVIESLIAAFPEQGDVWARSIQIGEGYKVTCSGFARNQPALQGLLDRLRARPDITGVSLGNMRGENPIQFSLTYKWEPRQ